MSHANVAQKMAYIGQINGLTNEHTKLLAQVIVQDVDLF